MYDKTLVMIDYWCLFIVVTVSTLSKVSVLSTSESHKETKFYWDSKALLFGLQFGNSCYIQEVSRDEAKELTDLASLVQFERKLLNAANQTNQHRWTQGHLRSKSSVLSDMCVFAVDIYVNPNGKLPIEDTLPRDCHDILMNGHMKSGEYDVYPNGKMGMIRVYCDMDTDAGGWLVFQRRNDGSVDFFRNWTDYKSGFGNLSDEFWLGNDNIYTLTKHRKYSLRVDMTTVVNEHGYAKYRRFYIGDESSKYVLHIEGFEGSAGDSLNNSNGMMFSTKDSDNDGWTPFLYSCAKRNEGGWWYNECAYANLNGVYRANDETTKYNIYWNTFRGYHPLKFTEMKIRPL